MKYWIKLHLNVKLETKKNYIKKLKINFYSTITAKEYTFILNKNYFNRTVTHLNKVICLN